MNLLIIDLKTLNFPRVGLRKILSTSEYKSVEVLEFNYVVYDMCNNKIISEGSNGTTPIFEFLENEYSNIMTDIFAIVGHNIDAIVKILYNKCSKIIEHNPVDVGFICTMRTGGRIFGTSNAYTTIGKLCELLGVQHVPGRNTFNCLLKIFRMMDEHNVLLKYEKIKLVS